MLTHHLVLYVGLAATFLLPGSHLFDRIIKNN